MAEAFDGEAWRQAITEPDWYVELYTELKALRQRWDGLEQAGEREAADSIKREVRGFFRDALAAGTVALGREGPDFDDERQPIDTVVVHHTSAAPGYDIGYMNATQLLNVYVPHYYHDPEREGLKGRPLWSGHERAGQQVFYVYHWLMRMDGSFERLLDDDEIGWHAANWDINCRSVGICLDNDYEKQDPAPEIIEKLGRFIAEHYPQVDSQRIFGHKEVSQHDTVCPGGHFLDGWKPELLGAVRAAAPGRS